MYTSLYSHNDWDPDMNLEKSGDNNQIKPGRHFLIELIYWIIYLRIKILSAREAARFLMILDNKLYSLQGNVAIRYGNGTHTKHKHLKYHDFFVNRINKTERVLDVGCGTGNVSYAVAMGSGATITGIDINPENIEAARKKFSNEKIFFITGDALTDLPKESFDVVILSNVLEHFERRIDFLRQLCLQVSPQRLLIRVPLFERDWRVPFKKEVGIDYRLDATHFIEYTLEDFSDEMREAGLTITYLESRWGEIWAEAVPDVT